MRTLRKALLYILLLLLLAAGAVTWWAGSELAHPGRRPLQDYHTEYITHPTEHGMVIKKFTLQDGTPCLLCEPIPDGQLGKRGQVIREQFAQKQIPLKPVGEILATLVLNHGRKGRKEDYLPIAERLCAVGFRCLMGDMLAHGESPHPHVFYGVKEADLPARLLNEAAQQFGFPPQPAGLLGMSMGGSVAMHATGEAKAPWKALVIISSYHAFLPAMELQASRLAGGFLGKPWALTAAQVYQWKTGMPLNEVRPEDYAAKLTIPTLILHGTDDRIVPLESGKKLYQALPANIEKQWVEIPSADHHNVLITEYPVYATVAEWMLKYVK